MSASSDSEESVIDLQDHETLNFTNKINKGDSTFYKIFRQAELNFDSVNTFDSKISLKNNKIFSVASPSNSEKSKHAGPGKAESGLSETEAKQASLCDLREFTIPKIRENFIETFVQNSDLESQADSQDPPQNSLQNIENLTQLYNLFSTYKDIYHSNNINAVETRKVYSAFILNHCYNFQKIIKNNDNILNKYRLARLKQLKLNELRVNFFNKF